MHYNFLNMCSVHSLLVYKILMQDLNRQVVRGDSASISIPSLDFEIPASSQKGTLSTVEGILQRTIEGLNQEQPIRRVRCTCYSNMQMKLKTA